MNKVISTSILAAALATAVFAQNSSCIPFVNGTGDYDKHCYNSGLLNMEEGACYTMNEDRGQAPVWINNMASESWWWTKVACVEATVESSSSEDVVSSSSVEESSSSEVESSSAVVESSSSEEESSSSVEESSSSVEESSSSVVESSSSEKTVVAVEKCVEFVNGTGDYDKHC
ncbi:MAG: hypothetical protein MJY82_02650, partial [Fibrobacter sp.]|nr:hypothetical protein [Fibrobacter sp.]